MKDKEIIIYGAGDYGRRMFDFLQEVGLKADFFCQTEPTEEKVLNDTPIITRKELLSRKKPAIVFIAMENENVSKQIKSILTSALPDRITVYKCGEFLKNNFDHSTYVSAVDKADKQKYCILCNRYLNEFGPAGISEEIFRRYHIIGGGYREHAACPYCGSLDRNRWALYVLNHYTDIFVRQCRVLHFAPEKALSERIRENAECDYYSGDIVPGKAQNVVNVLDIQFRNETFDYIIMNHVLEHIKDERKAISELMRVLKPEGKLILSFPICMDQKTYENSEIETKEDRLKYYGQEDHVRLYGTDYKERLEKYGLLIEIKTPQKECSQEEISKYGFIPDDVTLICRKNQEIMSL